ncbi:hypothetical protein ACTZWT_15675 [Rhodopseudomonas sp. NSM]|uniref:hypothetical protein n=1 Tax=Rhodopseudomonas sp. NSM TaxID=3457630 RepID=UPI0040366F4A
MSTHAISTFGSGRQLWTLPADEIARQAVASFRGYVYQIHQTASAWIALPENHELHIEVAEDFSEILRSPERHEEILQATQVKDTRESGAVTLNSSDVLDAIKHLFALQEANPGRTVRLTFLTTSPIGSERKNPLPSGRAGITTWQQINSNDDIDELRAALVKRITDAPLLTFLNTSSSDQLRSRLLDQLTFACGAGDWKTVESANRAALVAIRDEVKASLELAERAYDVVFAEVCRTLIESPTRMLGRKSFLECFEKATSIPIPSQTMINLLPLIPSPRSGEVVDENRLREFARALLEVNTPPSISALFLDVPTASKTALATLTKTDRTLAKPKSTAPGGAPMTIAALAPGMSGQHLFVGPPGSGKSHSLWHAAAEMLNTSTRIPLLLAIGSFASWQDVVDSLSQIGNGIDVNQVLRHEKVCLFVDGWSEFGETRRVEERAAAVRTLRGIPILATGRQVNASDTLFETWTLDPLPAALVIRTIRDAFATLPPPDPAFIDLLRSPLILSLYILLGGSSVATPGALLEQLHRHLMRDADKTFTEILAGAVASMTLSGSRSYARLLHELGSRAGKAGLRDPTRHLERLGTITERGGNVLPIHELYWSWLAGLGFLAEGRLNETILRLDTRESYELAFASGAIPSVDAANASMETDVVLAGCFESHQGVQSAARPFDRYLEALFNNEHLSIRYRAALAGLQSGKPRYLARSLSILSEVFGCAFFAPEMLTVFHPAALFAHRAIISDWLGSPGSEHFIDAVARRGGREWLPWLQQVMVSGKLQPHSAVAAALACGGDIPDWAAAHLEGLIRTAPWKLQPTADRGVNISVATWLAQFYGEIVDNWLTPNRSGWINVNRVLVSCGNDAVFDHLLTRFGTFSPKAQELLGFAVVNRGEPWVGRFQKAAFQAPKLNQHHELAEQFSADIDDATARHWIQLGYDELGWRVLVKRHGNAIIPELLQALPQSFENMHHIPALVAMTYLDDPPESLANEIWSRIRGDMQPKAMQDALESIARVNPTGVPSIVKFFLDQNGALPSYHVSQIVRLYSEWQKRTFIQLSVHTPNGDLPFSDFALLSNLVGPRDKDFLSHGFRYAPDLAVQLVSATPSMDNHTAIKLLGDLTPLERYEPALFARMISNEPLAKMIPALFSDVFDMMPAADMHRLVTSPYLVLDELLWRISRASNPLHKAIHVSLLNQVISAPPNLHHYRYIGELLRGYSRDEVRDILRPIIDELQDSALWLIRQIEIARQERLVNETGQLLEW